MFEVDLREDEADFSSKAMEAEIKELEEEIGELNGLDDDMVDCVGFGQSFQPTKIGSFVSMSAIPADWKEVNNSIVIHNPCNSTNPKPQP